MSDVSPVSHHVEVGRRRNNLEGVGGGSERRAGNSDESRASHLRSLEVG